jgi:hypothetical protein
LENATVDVRIEASTFERVNRVLYVEGAKSLAEKLGIPDVPPDQLKQFFDLLRAGDAQEAARKSGILAYLKDHAIELADLIGTIASSFK